MYGLWVYSVKTWVEIILGLSKSLRKLSEKIQATFRNISGLNSKILKWLLLFCMFPTLSMSGCCRAWQWGVNSSSAGWANECWTFDRPLEIEFSISAALSCVTFHDILSKGGPLFYSNNNWFNFHQIKIRIHVLDSLDMIPKNSKPKNLFSQEKQIRECWCVKRWALGGRSH